MLPLASYAAGVKLDPIIVGKAIRSEKRKTSWH